jgi:hypothetical protein
MHGSAKPMRELQNLLPKQITQGRMPDLGQNYSQPGSFL